MISEVLASVLRSGRAEFNARFAEARLRFPELEAAEFGGFLAGHIDPLALAVERTQKERTAAVVQAAYEIALGLVGEKLAGGQARQGVINEGWRALFPKLAAHIAAAPAPVLTAFTNALHHLGAAPGARPQQWMELMARHGGACAGVEQLLALGQFAAWRAGLAHLRAGALRVADSLPEPLAVQIVGAEGRAWSEVRNQLAANPWFDPAQPVTAAPRVAAQTGTFRGYGGLFIEPPLVAACGEDFIVRSGEECWHLTADAFGATFHRASREEFAAAEQGQPLPHDVQLDGARLAIRGQHFEIPELGTLTSAAANAATVAITGLDTHAVTLLALR